MTELDLNTVTSVEKSLRYALNRGKRDEMVSAASFAMGVLAVTHSNPQVRTLMVENRALLDNAELGVVRREAQSCLILLDALRAKK